FYLHDPAWGPAFIKIGTYVPYPIKICLNCHEWVKQQLRQAHIPFTSLDNGFLACADPRRLQTICDRLAPRDTSSIGGRTDSRGHGDRRIGRPASITASRSASSKSA